jgi:predicted amidophosphoribosyltransferase
MSEVENSEPLRCPTCRAPWRGVSACPRCGTDLAPLMGVAARAWQLREAARAALEAGRAHDACDLASAALRLHATPRGRRVHVLALLAAGRTLDVVRALNAPE